MPRTSVLQPPAASLTRIPWYPEDLLHDLQTTLAAVADIDARYDREREQLAARTASELVGTQTAADLEAQRRAEREPCARRLAELHHRMMAAMAYQDIWGSAQDD